MTPSPLCQPHRRRPAQPGQPLQTQEHRHTGPSLGPVVLAVDMIPLPIHISWWFSQYLQFGEGPYYTPTC